MLADKICLRQEPAHNYMRGYTEFRFLHLHFAHSWKPETGFALPRSPGRAFKTHVRPPSAASNNQKTIGPPKGCPDADVQPLSRYCDADFALLPFMNSAAFLRLKRRYAGLWVTGS
jgi:hypothetical protein